MNKPQSSGTPYSTHRIEYLPDRNGEMQSACRAGKSHGYVTDARDSTHYHCALRLALQLAGTSFTPHSTVTLH